MSIEIFGAAAKKPAEERIVGLDFEEPQSVEMFDGNALFSQVEMGGLPVPLENNMNVAGEGSPVVAEEFQQEAANDALYNSPKTVSGEVLEGQWTVEENSQENNGDIEDVEVIAEQPATFETQIEAKETAEETEWSKRLGELSGRFTGNISNFLDGWNTNRNERKKQEALVQEYRQILEYRIGPRLTILRQDPVYEILMRSYPALDQGLLDGDHYDFEERQKPASLLRNALYSLFGTERSLDLVNLQMGVESAQTESVLSLEYKDGEPVPLEGEYIPRDAASGVGGREQLRLEHKPIAIPEVVASEVASGGELGEAYREGLLQLVDKTAEKAPGTAVTAANT